MALKIPSEASKSQTPKNSRRLLGIWKLGFGSFQFFFFPIRFAALLEPQLAGERRFVEHAVKSGFVPVGYRSSQSVQLIDQRIEGMKSAGGIQNGGGAEGGRTDERGRGGSSGKVAVGQFAGVGPTGRIAHGADQRGGGQRRQRAGAGHQRVVFFRADEKRLRADEASEGGD